MPALDPETLHTDGFMKARDLLYVLVEMALAGYQTGDSALVEAARATVSLRPHPRTRKYHNLIRQAEGGIFYTVHTDNELLAAQLNANDCFFVLDTEREAVGAAFSAVLAAGRERLDAVVAAHAAPTASAIVTD